MRRLLFILLVMSGVLIAHFSVGQTKDQIISSFKNVVEETKGKFTEPPVLMSDQNFSSSVSGKIYYKLKFNLRGASYDIQKTNSLISPYLGTITLTLYILSNATNGDVKGSTGNVGFSDSAAANSNNIFEAIGDQNISINWGTGNILIEYAYQNKKWVFKNINTEVENKIPMGVLRGDIDRGILNNLLDR